MFLLGTGLTGQSKLLRGCPRVSPTTPSPSSLSLDPALSYTKCSLSSRSLKCYRPAQPHRLMKPHLSGGWPPPVLLLPPGLPLMPSRTPHSPGCPEYSFWLLCCSPPAFSPPHIGVSWGSFFGPLFLLHDELLLSCGWKYCFFPQSLSNIDLQSIPTPELLIHTLAAYPGTPVRCLIGS